MKFTGLVPMLHTNDLQRTIDWYETRLGFSCGRRAGDDWCWLRRDAASLMFMRNDHFDAPCATATQYVYVDDVMGLWETIKDRCAAEWGPERQSYGMLEFAIRDPNGYLLSFGQAVA